MKVFVSSVVGGYTEFRNAAKDAIEALGHEPVVMEVTHHSAADPPRAECFAQIEDSDVVVMLLGARYGEPQQSGKSATHEEWDHAYRNNKPILPFVEDLDDHDQRDPQQQDFLVEIGGWEEGAYWGRYSSPLSLVTELVKSLNAHEQRARATTDTISIERLPLTCRERLEALRGVSPTVADRLIELMCDPASRQPTALMRLAEEPPDWLQSAGYGAWEVISDFIDAHSLSGSDSIRQRAIEAGSPRSGMHMIRRAEALADAGDTQGAADLLAQVPSDYPLLDTARAHINDDATGVINAVLSEGLHRHEDPELALYSVARLAAAHGRLNRPDLARSVLREANARFPGRAWLLFHEVNAILRAVDQVGLGTAGSHDLLSEAAELAVEARDLFRTWDGPSHLAVAVAMQARTAMDDAEQAVVLGSAPPEGEATDTETASADVQRQLAHALLMLRRYEAIDTVSLDRIGPADAALIRAMQARGRGDPTATSRMRQAVAQASDNSRRRALLGLALFGEVDEAQMAEVSESDAALFRGAAALNREELNEAKAILAEHWLDSPIHAGELASAQHQAGATGDAVETLTAAADHFGTEWLRVHAVEMLVDTDQLEEAASIASDALERSPSRGAHHRLRQLLANVAEQRRDWQAMESHTRALVRESPRDEQAGWAVVYALWNQAKYQQAWGFIVGHGLQPFDEESARLMIAVCADADSPEDTAGPLLEIARMYTDSEVVAGSAIGAVMMGGDRVRLTEAQRVQLNELAEDFLERFPDSDILRSVSFSGPEEAAQVMSELTRASALHSREFGEQVRYGRLPYGLMQQVSGLPYAELLLSVAAGSITAIAADQQQRDTERQVAEAALGTVIAVDTSVTATGINAGIDLRRLALVFRGVLVGDELIADARTAVARASQPIEATASYEPALGRISMTLIDEQQRSARAERCQNVLEILSGWQSVTSGPLPSPTDAQHLELRPWDTSIRVALHRRCALWCDDLAMRSVAAHEGIPTFGTWALYEALVSTPAGAWLPPPTEMKMQLLRARIADVPITVPELADATDRDEVLDFAVYAYLSRPLTWTIDLQGTLGLFRDLVTNLGAGDNRQWIPELLDAASFGVGTAADSTQRNVVIGALFVTAVLHTWDPSIVPALIIASRTAAGHLDPAEEPDPLPFAVQRLLEALESYLDPHAAAQTVVWMFAEAQVADRNIVTSIVLGER